MQIRFPLVAGRTASVTVVCLMLQALPTLAQEPRAPQTTATPAAQQPAAAKKPPPPKSLASWRGKVIAHLNSRKGASAVADGTATVAFKIDRSGKVMTAQVLTSSGSKALDAEAVALTQRASPVPAPPADIAGDTLYLKVPIRFKK